jgi:hypothetical protein
MTESCRLWRAIADQEFVNMAADEMMNFPKRLVLGERELWSALGQLGTSVRLPFREVVGRRALR